ncbi:MAG: polysaccharide biosynthesis tyrosine autokinase [Clostridia bacterium]
MENSIDVKTLFTNLKEHIFIITFMMFLAAFFTALVYTYFVPSEYTSKAMLYVENKVDSTSPGFVNNDDIMAAQQLVKNCKELFLSPTVLDDVINGLELDMSRDDLKKIVTVDSVNSTEIMQIGVQTTNPYLAAQIANKFIEASYKEFKRVIKTGSIEIVDYGKVITTKSYPNTTMAVLIVSFLAALVTYGITFFAEFFNTSVKSDDKLSEKFQLPVFASIPDFNSKNTGAQYYKYKNKYQAKTSDQPSEEAKTNEEKEKLYANFNKSISAESYNSIRTNLQFALGASDKNILAFTSSNPSEGKSTTATNTAISFANAGYKVLLVDCDLRRPKIHRLLKIDGKRGFSHLLCDFCTKDEAVVKNVIKNLDVIPVGKIPPNPSELLASNKMISIVNSLAEEYDYVFLDTPPVNVVSDALLFNKLNSGVVFVVREEETTYQDVSQAIQQIKATDGKIFGFIKNFCHFKSKSYSYKKSGYSYGYYK